MPNHANHNPWKRLLCSARWSGRRKKERQGKKNNVSFTFSDIEQKFKKQDRRCYWFKIKLNPKDVFKTNYPLAMSLDRLDNNKGYELDNVVICCRLANMGRARCSVDVFRKIVKRIKK